MEPQPPPHLQSLRVIGLLADAPQVKRVALHAQLPLALPVTDTTSDPPAAVAATAAGASTSAACDALLILEQVALPTQLESLQSLLGALQFSVQFHNDRYWKMSGSLAGAPLLGVDLRVTCPASASELDKERARDYVLVRETRDAYARVVAPFIDALPAARTQWLRNILDGWDQRSVRQLYCQAIVRGGGGGDGTAPLRSLRELRSIHAPLLRRVQRAALAALTHRYGVSPAHIFAYLHYQPSFYHLHVHFVHLAHAGEGGGVSHACHRAHLLDTVIDHLEMGGIEYYANATLTYPLGEGDALLAALRERSPETLALDRDE